MTTTPTACVSSRRCAAPAAWPSGRWGWWGGYVSSGRWWRGAGWWVSTPPGNRSAPSPWIWPASPWGCPSCWRGPPPASTPKPRGATWRAVCWGGSCPPPSWSPKLTTAPRYWCGTRGRRSRSCGRRSSCSGRDGAPTPTSRCEGPPPPRPPPSTTGTPSAPLPPPPGGHLDFYLSILGGGRGGSPFPTGHLGQTSSRQ